MGQCGVWAGNSLVVWFVILFVMLTLMDILCFLLNVRVNILGKIIEKKGMNNAQQNDQIVIVRESAKRY